MEVTRDDVLGFIRLTLAERLGVGAEQITDGARMYELPGIDSITVLKATLDVEQRFGVTLDISQAFALHTIGELADQVVITIEEQLS
jgi:acyl carrier protein